MKFRVGDTIKQVKAGNAPENINEIIKIESIEGDVKSNRIGGDNCKCWTMDYLVENFELVESKFNVGDKVRVREELIEGEWYGGLSLNSTMAELGEKELTIKNIMGRYYQLVEDKSGFYWSEEMLEPIEKTDEMAKDAIREYAEVFKFEYNTEPIKSLKDKTMGVIKTALKSKEQKALDYFSLANGKDLNEQGRAEFIDYLYANMKEEKAGFIEKIVEAHREEE